MNYGHNDPREGEDWIEPEATLRVRATAEELELEDGYLIDGVGFEAPGTALRRATASNPRNLPCPTCKEPNRLTPLDKARGYQCDACADRDERGGY